MRRSLLRALYEIMEVQPLPQQRLTIQLTAELQLPNHCQA